MEDNYIDRDHCTAAVPDDLLIVSHVLHCSVEIHSCITVFHNCYTRVQHWAVTSSLTLTD